MGKVRQDRDTIQGGCQQVGCQCRDVLKGSIGKALALPGSRGTMWLKMVQGHPLCEVLVVPICCRPLPAALYRCRSHLERASATHHSHLEGRWAKRLGKLYQSDSCFNQAEYIYILI